MHFNSLDSEMFKQGYHYGEKMNLNSEIVPPKGLTEEEESDW